jgi:DNA-binding NarL/FixJ family response regulator
MTVTVTALPTPVRNRPTAPDAPFSGPAAAPPRALDRTRKVAIVDDQPMTRSGLEQLAAGIPELSVCASVAMVEELDELGVEYAVVVLHVPAREEDLAVKTITRLAQTSRPLVISAWDRPPSLLTTIRAGACGCLTRRSGPESVARALGVVAAGGFYLCEQLVDRFQAELRQPPRADPHGLTPREVETLRWIARGLTHTQIATRMGLSQATVNTYAKRIRGKLKVGNKAELTRIAIELGHFGEDHLDPTAA